MLLASRPSAADKVAALRQAITRGTLSMPGCFNAPVAMMAEKLGF